MSRNFVPRQFSRSDDQEDEGNQLVRELIKHDAPYVKLRVSESDKAVGKDGFIELRNNKHVIGKLEVQMKPVRSQRNKNGRPCFNLEANLVGHSKYAGLPFILICYDRIEQKAYWKLVNEQLFLNIPDSQKSVTIYFDPIEDGIGKGLPYLKKWKQLAKSHLDIIEEWKQFEKDMSLSEIPNSQVDAYQRFVDTLNFGLDGEFFSVKNIAFNSTWKFGVCIFEASAHGSWHRLYQIPRGQNGPLVIKMKAARNRSYSKAFREARKRPLGNYSKIFRVTAQSDSIDRLFFRHPEIRAQEFLYNEFQLLQSRQAFPLYGYYLCLEQIFEFTDKFRLLLGGDEEDVVDLSELLIKIEAVLSRWMAQAVIENIIKLPNTLSSTWFEEVLCDAAKNHFQPNFRKGISQKELSLTKRILDSDLFRLVSSSCRSLINGGNEVVNRPYKKVGETPVSMSVSADPENLKYNLHVIAENVGKEYEAFSRGNGFTRLWDQPFLNPTVSIVFLVDFDRMVNVGTPSDLFSVFNPFVACYRVVNPGDLPKSWIEFVNHVPEPVPLLFLKEREIQVIQMLQRSTKVSHHPLRDLVYQMFRKDSQRCYDPNFSERRHWY